MISALNSGKRGLGLRLGWVNVLRSWTKHFTFTVPPPRRKYVLASCQGSLMKCWGGEREGEGEGEGEGSPCNGLVSHPGGSSDTPSSFKLRKLR